MRDPGAVEAVAGLALLVRAHLRRARRSFDLGVAAVRDERGHAADRVRAAPVAGPHEQLGVRPHERHRHRDLRRGRAARTSGRSRKRLDDAEDVVPAAGVEPGRVVAQLVEDLVHLERGGDRLDQHGRADGARAGCRARPARGRRRRSRAAPRGGSRASAGRSTGPLPRVELPLRVVEEVQPEVEQARRRPARRRPRGASRRGASRAGAPRASAVSSPSRYFLPSGVVDSRSCRSRASSRFSWPLDARCPRSGEWRPRSRPCRPSRRS